MGRKRNTPAGNDVGSVCSNDTVRAHEDQRECSPDVESLTETEEQQSVNGEDGNGSADRGACGEISGDRRPEDVHSLLADLSRRLGTASGVLQGVVAALEKDGGASRPERRAETDTNINSWSGTMRGVSGPGRVEDLHDRPQANQSQDTHRSMREDPPREGEVHRPRRGYETGQDFNIPSGHQANRGQMTYRPRREHSPRECADRVHRQNVEYGFGDPWGLTHQGDGHPRGRQDNPNKVVKIPPFDGKEDWRVWLSRFEVIAKRMRWSIEEKLDNLLPRMEGAAAEFVFSQLPPNVLHDYTPLVAELNSRYRVIETPRTYAAQFSSRNQKKGETVEEYAAELKRLYDRAHGYRDADTRQEDLVRRFLDGLWNDEARFEVEYHKDPATIDEAVYHVVTFLHTRRRFDECNESRPRRPLRKLDDRCKTEIGEEIFDSEDQKVEVSRQAKEQRHSTETDVKNLGKSNSIDQNTYELLMSIVSKLDLLTKSKTNEEMVGQQRQDGKGGAQPRFTCFKCGEEGHFARNCPSTPGQVTRQRGDKPYYRNRWGNNTQDQGVSSETSRADHLN